MKFQALIICFSIVLPLFSQDKGNDRSRLLEGLQSLNKLSDQIYSGVTSWIEQPLDDQSKVRLVHDLRFKFPEHELRIRNLKLPTQLNQSMDSVLLEFKKIIEASDQIIFKLKTVDDYGESPNLKLAKERFRADVTPTYQTIKRRIRMLIKQGSLKK